ncbi:MAG TPA: hypothetical protein VMX14_13455 [Anaerolineae bacterium]|nr:hypothetical protein [Anaerolineae bacterium]
MQRIFTLSFCVPGTLGANVLFYWKAPFDCTILHVSAVASNDSDATIKIGDSADSGNDDYLAAAVIGDSAVPAEFARTDFVGDQYPRIHDGDITYVTVDYDGASGTAAADLTVVLTLAEG